MTVPSMRLASWFRRLYRGRVTGRTAGIAIVIAAVVIVGAALAMRGGAMTAYTTTTDMPVMDITAMAPALPACDGCSLLPGLLSADAVPEAPATPAPPNDPAVQASMPGCAEWTDRCVTCRRESGQIACSNIGIACQPQAVVCLRATPAEDKPAQPAGK